MPLTTNGLSDNCILIQSLEVSTYTIPTQSPESDGTLQWNQTTLVLVTVHAGGKTGIGYTYADQATAALIHEKMREVVIGRDVMDVTAIWSDIVRLVRNLGRPGIVSMALSAVDTALWDLKSRLLGVPLAKLLGTIRASVPLYGSGGFTSYSDNELAEQLGAWANQGFTRVKMKVGRKPARDLKRVQIARQAIGPQVELFVDANGAYDLKQALQLSEEFVRFGVRWFEEPVSSDHLSGLSFLRSAVPASINIAAGEYGYDLVYFKGMLESQAVDVLQADITRCGGVTGFLQVTDLCDAFSIPLSAHCAPSLHLHVACASPPLRHIEYFFDHTEIEKRLFEGYRTPIHGQMYPDLSRPGHGLEFKKKDAEKLSA